MNKKQTKSKESLIPQEHIENRILIIRGHKVMLDKDLAILYGVETKVLNQAVKRNLKRFPDDFMFQMTKEEFENWSCQFAPQSYRINLFKVTKCDLKKRTTSQIFTLCFYRTRDRHAFQRS